MPCMATSTLLTLALMSVLLCMDSTRAISCCNTILVTGIGGWNWELPLGFYTVLNQTHNNRPVYTSNPHWTTKVVTFDDDDDPDDPAPREFLATNVENFLFFDQDKWLISYNLGVDNGYDKVFANELTLATQVVSNTCPTIDDGANWAAEVGVPPLFSLRQHTPIIVTCQPPPICATSISITFHTQLPSTYVPLTDQEAWPPTFTHTSNVDEKLTFFRSTHAHPYPHWERSSVQGGTITVSHVSHETTENFGYVCPNNVTWQPFHTCCSIYEISSSPLLNDMVTLDDDEYNAYTIEALFGEQILYGVYTLKPDVPNKFGWPTYEREDGVTLCFADADDDVMFPRWKIAENCDGTDRFATQHWVEGFAHQLCPQVLPDELWKYYGSVIVNMTSNASVKVSNFDFPLEVTCLSTSPTTSPTITTAPTTSPTFLPSQSSPTKSPTLSSPTVSPTTSPTISPTAPTASPSSSPSQPPSVSPTLSAIAAAAPQTYVAAVVAALGGVVVLAAVLVFMVVYRRRKNKTRQLLRKRNDLANQLLVQANETFYQYYSHIFNDSASKFKLEDTLTSKTITRVNTFSQPREIARGNGGVIHKSKYRDGVGVVVNVAIKSCHPLDVAANRRLLVEARLLLWMEHPAIMRLHALHLFKSNRPWLIMVFMQNGDLKTYLRGVRQQQQVRRTKLKHSDSEVFTRSHAAEIATRVAGALIYLEQAQIIHGDIAARNVLCGSTPTDVRLSDFGNATPTHLAANGNLGDRYSAGGQSIPFRWMAPEALLESKLSHMTDIWSFGVLLWEIDTYGKTPFGVLSIDDIKSELLRGQRLHRAKEGIEGLYNVAATCWKTSDVQRPTAHQLHQQLSALQRSLARLDFQAEHEENEGYLAVEAVA